LFHLGNSGALLALHAGRPVHRRDAAVAARHRRQPASLDCAAPRSRFGRRRRSEDSAMKLQERLAKREQEAMEAFERTLLFIENVTVSFDGFRALNNLSFTIEPGEMRAIIGPNGAGKTTMMDVVTGKTRPDTGSVIFDQRYDLARLDETQIALLGIGRKFQKPTVFESHTVEDNLRLALKSDKRARTTLMWRDSDAERQALTHILETIRLTAVRQRIAGSLSHGQKQWLEIGMLLAQEP